MALSGLIVECGIAAAPGGGGSAQVHGKCLWSESVASGSSTSNTAPSGAAAMQPTLFRIVATVDSYVAVGATPDATQSPRRALAAGQVLEVAAAPGDKVGYLAA